MAEDGLLYSELTRLIIGAAREVHKVLGIGFLESVYEEAFAIELQLRKIPYEGQKPIEVFYKNRLAKEFVCDFTVYDKIIVELKAIKKIIESLSAELFESDWPAFRISA